jgi:hypothetical protein
MTPHLLHVFLSFSAGGTRLRTVHVMTCLADPGRHTVISIDGVTTPTDRISEGIVVEILSVMVRTRRPVFNLLGLHRVVLMRHLLFGA